MKKQTKLISTALTAAMVLQTVSLGAVLAACSPSATRFEFTDSEISVSAGTYSGYKISGTDLTINSAGTYEVSGSCSDGTITVKKGTEGVNLVLNGLTLTSADSAPLCFNKSSEVTLTAKENSVNTLSDTEKNNDDNYADNTEAENAVIKCKDGSDVIINGSGTINIESKGKNGIKSGATTDDEGEASLTIDGAVLNISAPVNDAINAESDLTVKSGTLNISAGDDAIHSDYALTIGTEGADGTPIININSCYEGLEGANVTIYSGDIDIHSEDDGINAANSDLTNYSYTLDINGGDIYVDAEKGDGIDSNGTLTINGGNVTVFSTSSGANAPLDSDGKFTVNGGTVLAVGNSGMAQTPASGSQSYITFGAKSGGPGGMGGPGGDRPTFGGAPQQGGEDNGNPPAKPDGEDGANGTTPPAKPDGDDGASGKTPPARPDGENNGNAPRMRGGRGMRPDGGNGEQNTAESSDRKADKGGNVPQGADDAQGTSVSISAGDKLTITDSTGKETASATAVRGANYVFYSSASLSDSETYTLKANGNSLATATVSESAQSGGTGGTPGMQGGNGMTPPANSDGTMTPPSGTDGNMPTPPNGGVPGGAPGGMPGGASSAPTSYNAANTFSVDTVTEGKTYASTGTDENAVLVTDGSTVIRDSSITRNSDDSTGGDNSSFYGIGAAALVTDGNLYIKDSTVTTDAKGGAGVFAYGDGTAYVADTKIDTSKDTSGGIHAAGGGTLYAWDLDITTRGESSAAIRSDRGGGKMVVDGGTYVSNGTGSPAVYSTADIAVNGATLTANNSEAVCIEGLNSLSLYGSTLSGNMKDDERNDTTWNVIVYQSMSGDSEIGCGKFAMKDGKLIANNGGMFYTTNTESEFYLENVDITSADDGEFFLRASGNNNQRGWGTSGSNGADCLFTAVNQTMDGDIIWDGISTLDFYMADGSKLTGAVTKDTAYSGNGYAKLYIDETSEWTVTGDSTLSALYCAGKIADSQGKTVSVVKSDGTVLVSGDSEYKITVDEYSQTADMSGKGTYTAWETYATDRPTAFDAAITETSGSSSSSGSSSGSSSSGSHGSSVSGVSGSTSTAGGSNEGMFKDTDRNAWYYDAVKFMRDNNLMKGTSDSEFSPDAPITRAMFITVLYRMENEPQTGAKSGFTDVDRGDYYADAVDWAVANGIINGVSDTSFAPNDNITRDQMAAIMYRYAGYKQMDTASDGGAAYADGDSIPGYSKDAAAWASGKKIMSGFEDNTFRPNDDATRAQAATVLMNLCNMK